VQSFELNGRRRLTSPTKSGVRVCIHYLPTGTETVPPATRLGGPQKNPGAKAPGLSDVLILCQAMRVARYGETGAALPEPVLSEVLLVLSRLLLVPLRFIELLLRSEEPDCNEGVEYPPTDSARATAD
jgi:hypothetical protein